MNIIATRKAEQNRAAIDPWTAVHVAAGLAAGLMNVPIRWAMGFALGYELAEQWLERLEWGQDLFETSGPEAISNAVMDSVVFYAGYRLGERWNRTR